MAKKSSIEKNNRRAKLARQKSPQRERLKAIARDRDAPGEERFEAQLKLAEMPRNSSPTPILITILSSRGTCIGFWYPNSCIRAGRTSAS